MKMRRRKMRLWRNPAGDPCPYCGTPLVVRNGVLDCPKCSAPPGPLISRGRYVNLIEEPNRLVFELTPQGRADFADIQHIRDTRGINDALCELLEDFLCNGWEFLQSGDYVAIGSLTDALLLSPYVERTDEGDFVSVDTIYWNPNYMVEDDIETLESTGRLIWKRA